MEQKMFNIPTTFRRPFKTISYEELEKISDLSEIERATRIPIAEALFMKTSDESSRFSWSYIKDFVIAESNHKR